MGLSSANAKITNAHDFWTKEFSYEPANADKGDDFWYAKPLRIQAPSDEKLKPQIMWVHLHSTGYSGVFNQYVEINCKEPIKSHIMIGADENMSLKDSMAIDWDPWNDDYKYRIDRNVVGELFSFYCK